MIDNEQQLIRFTFDVDEAIRRAYNHDLNAEPENVLNRYTTVLSDQEQKEVDDHWTQVKDLLGSNDLGV